MPVYKMATGCHLEVVHRGKVNNKLRLFGLWHLNIKEMVVWLTAFALSQENCAIRLGVLAQTLLPALDLPAAEGWCYSWMERGQIRWSFWDTRKQ